MRGWNLPIKHRSVKLVCVRDVCFGSVRKFPKYAHFGMFWDMQCGDIFAGGSILLLKLCRRVICGEYRHEKLHSVRGGNLLLKYRPDELDCVRDVCIRPVRMRHRTLGIDVHWHLRRGIVFGGGSIGVRELRRRLLR